MDKHTSAKDLLCPKIDADKAWYLALLDPKAQLAYEKDHLDAVLRMLKICYISRFRRRIAQLREECEALRGKEDYNAEDFRTLQEKKAEIAENIRRMNEYRPYFSEPYFARMDVVDDKEGYNSYYIGKKGDVNLEIVDWRAPLAVRYYQKSRVTFTINEYEYRTVLRRALSVRNGKVLDFKNEYLSVGDVLTPEEIGGRDEEILFDPYLRSIIQSRKDDVKVRDIIRTIQEQQFDIVTKPERESFVLQGCAGSGKTMILLHRLSYLMYNNESLRPGDVLVITPSESFNGFIDELSQMLELEKVRTTTLRDYYFRALSGEGIDLKSRLTDAREPEEYLAYVYSARFPRDVSARIHKLYEELFALFTAPECRSVSEAILAMCRARQAQFVRIRNGSVRVRRAVLGELKESKEGGFYFTKPFRTLMSAFTQAEDFLRFVLEEHERTPDYFFRQFSEFYRNAHLIAAGGEKVFRSAQEDLASLVVTVDKEIVDLMRYKQKRGTEEVLTYADRIARREQLKAEAERTRALIGEMEEGLSLFSDFFAVIRLTRNCVELGKCRGGADVARWLYRETVRPAKTKHGMKGVYPSDGYAMCFCLTEAGRELKPRYGLVFVDEGQDISEGEYALLHRIHSDAAFNVFGDLKQNITPWRGVRDWAKVGGNLYTLNQNYRNTNEIVAFVSRVLDADMRPIGLEGPEVAHIKPRQVSAFFREKQGLKAVIAKEEYLPFFDKRGYKVLTGDAQLSRSKINVMSVFASKGLEFSAVAVYDKGMTENEKYIAYTRALRELAIIEDD